MADSVLVDVLVQEYIQLNETCRTLTSQYGATLGIIVTGFVILIGFIASGNGHKNGEGSFRHGLVLVSLVGLFLSLPMIGGHLVALKNFIELQNCLDDVRRKLIQQGASLTGCCMTTRMCMHILISLVFISIASVVFALLLIMRRSQFKEIWKYIRNPEV